MSASAPVADVHLEQVQSLRFDDMDAMASALNGDLVDFIPIGAGRFQGRVSRIDLGSVDIRRVVHAPFLVHGEVPSNQVALNLQEGPSRGLTLNGDALDTPTLAVLPEGAAIQAVCPTEQDRIGLVFRAEEFDRLIEVYGVQAFPRGQHRMLHLHENQASRLVRTFTTITDLADNMPNLFAVPGLGKAMTEECHRVLAAVLFGGEDHLERPRQTKDMLRQVRAADEFLHTNIDHPVYTSELCAALQVSARTLHQSFAAVYGMSPQAYLKRRRLVLVHRALRSTRDDHTMVKSVVLAHGFFHLGRFAHEYAAMFGEMPSETLGKGYDRRRPMVA